jgi:hypothetical protein
LGFGGKDTGEGEKTQQPEKCEVHKVT